MVKNNNILTPVQKRQRRERIFGFAAVLAIIAAWVFGALRAKSDLMPAVWEAMPEADHFIELDDDLYQAWGDASETELLGYVAFGEASGYGGPMSLAVAVSLEGEILGVAVSSHKETPSWMDRVTDKEFIDSLIGKHYTDPFELEGDIDGVTGATYSARAIAQAVLEGSQITAEHLGMDVPERTPPKIIFGPPEIVLLLLFAVGYIGHKPNFKYKKQIRWASMLTGMVVLGFIYNSPLTIVYINKFLMGFWPQWQANLFWYILIAGILFVYSVDNKNPYCEWFCPFGAAQECMGVIGGAKVRSPGRYRIFLKWLQRSLSLGVILIALILRNPGVSSYEIFGTLFELIGSNYQFLLLGLILVVSLFIRRPWCEYLCPLHPVGDFIRLTRKWIIELWPKRKRNA